MDEKCDFRHPPQGPDFKKDPLTEDESALFGELANGGVPRRDFLKMLSGAGAGVFGMQLLTEQQAYAAAASLGETTAVATTGPTISVNLIINGTKKTVDLEPRVTLLDALREKLAMTGSKKGCDHGQCGACTVIVDGKRVLSCLTLAAQAEGKEITTVEGLATDAGLHPMQEAFIEHDSFQCGYCTPGQLCSAVALLDEAKRGEASYVTSDLNAPPTELSDDEVRERMSGNICRCAAYPQILAAFQAVHTGRDTARTWGFAKEDELALIRKEFAHETV
jgi:xanthine dehydrogenase YagT iron-sulfur-binding subunit